ncbi:MAG: OmpH family outer membrane protein [Candidatus Sumerlaeia bacterium]|nr:OmpH family outer membrane protein [Candidatus Sumerlaeia bacterium]
MINCSSLKLRQLAAFAGIALCSLPIGLYAQSTPPAPVVSSTSNAPQGKIGFVDIEIVIEQSTAIRMAMDSLDQVLAGKAREIDLKEREFRRMRFEIDKQERVISGEEREKRRAELLLLQEEIEKLKFEFDSELRIRERQVEPVLEKVMTIVADIADEQGYDLVLRGEVIIYGRDSADLTKAVIERLDSNVAEVLQLFKDADPTTKAGQAGAATESSASPEGNSTESAPTDAVTPAPAVVPVAP